MNKGDKLLAMGNQIAAFWRSQPGDQAGAIASHLQRFWTPSMCDALTAHVRAGAPAEPLIRAAIERLSHPE